jgi:hypothetical protein
MTKKELTRLLAWGIVLCLAATQPTLAQKGKGKGGGGGKGTEPAELQINDDAALGDFTVLSDDKGAYVDHRLDGGDPCVASFVWGDGQYTALMDFNIDIVSGCNSLRPADARTFKLRFPYGHAACGLFGLSGPVCTLVLDPADADAQIHIPEFIQQGRTQDIRVRFSFVEDGVSYEVHPVDRTQIVVTESGLTTTVSLDDDGVLEKKVKNKFQPVGVSFPLRFELNITRVE